MSKITEQEIIIWYLNKHCKYRGYDLPDSEMKQFVKHSDEQMERAYSIWFKKLIRKLKPHGILELISNLDKLEKALEN